MSDLLGLPTCVDVRLVVCDMDGTLLDAGSAVPAAFWPLLERMRERGIVFAPASGRQVASLAELFSPVLDGMTLIGENGAFVVRDGVEVSSAVLSREVVEEVTRVVRDGQGLRAVICGKRSAYLDATAEPQLVELCRRFYVDVAEVDDVLDHDDEVLKLGVYCFGRSDQSLALFEHFGPDHQVVPWAPDWIDIMPPGVHKGVAVRALQAELGVTPEQTVVFGDSFNDLEMLDEAHWSFAMADARPEIRTRANHLAPAHTEQGVLQVLTRLIGL